MKLRPNDFSDILTTEVGFNSTELLYCPTSNKGFDRPIYAFWKREDEASKELCPAEGKRDDIATTIVNVNSDTATSENSALI